MQAYTSKIQLNRQKKEALRAWMFSTSFKATLIIGIITLGILYVLQMTALSTKGFAITDLQKQLTSLKHEDRNLTVQIAEYRSMTSLQERLARLDLVPVDNVTYIDTSVSVAFNN